MKVWTEAMEGRSPRRGWRQQIFLILKKDESNPLSSFFYGLNSIGFFIKDCNQNL